MTAGNSLLFVDAYDSFTNNIVALLYQSVPGVDVEVIHIDTDIQKTYSTDIGNFLLSFDAVVLGPGPGDPHNHADIGCIADIWPLAEKYQIPVLGICLGFQSLCLQYGIPVVRMHEPCHGQSKQILSNKQDIFLDLQDLSAVCYNSLAVKVSTLTHADETSNSNSPRTSLSSGSADSNETEDDGPLAKHIRLLAWDTEGNAMAVKHEVLPFWGVQFHPESCKSDVSCRTLLRNWYQAVEEHNHSRKRKPAADLGKRHRPIGTLHATTHSQQSEFTRHVLTCLPNIAAAVRWKVANRSAISIEFLRDLCYHTTREGSVAILESSSKGRFSIYSFTDPTTISVYYQAGILGVFRGMNQISQHTCSADQAMSWLEELMTSLSVQGGHSDIPFWGGLVGYFSYEFCLDLLKLKSNTRCKDFGRIVPDFQFSFVDRSVVHDKVSGEVYVQSLRQNDDSWLNGITTNLEHSSTSKATAVVDSDFLRKHLGLARLQLPDHNTYLDQIRTCKSHLYAGNSYELCLTTEATTTVPNSDIKTSFELYTSLNSKNPVPFASLLHFPRSDTTILSTSPEQFLTTSRNGTVDMKPMKGTVARTSTTTLADARRILATTKESAENLMIADLIRHDLYGTVGCHYPTTPTTDPVQVIKLNEVTEYETVYQLTSHIRAVPPPDLSSDFSASHKDTPSNSRNSSRTHNMPDPPTLTHHNFRALRHTLPPGSMTGAPKARSCQILSDIEQRPRGVYSGIIGFFDVGGGSSWSVAIRTAFSCTSNLDSTLLPNNGDVDADKFSTTSNTSADTIIVDPAGSTPTATIAQPTPNPPPPTKQTRKWHIGAGGAITVLSDNEAEFAEMSTKLASVLRGFGVG